MRYLICVCILLFGSVNTTMAWYPEDMVHPINTPNPIRQAGDTIANAYVIDRMPYELQSTTISYSDDYDNECVEDNEDAPDVAFRFTSETDFIATIDLDGESGNNYIFGLDPVLNIYDVKNNSLELVMHVDDTYHYPDTSIYIRQFTFCAYKTYYIVVDGYRGTIGIFDLKITAYNPGLVTMSELKATFN